MRIAVALLFSSFTLAAQSLAQQALDVPAAFPTIQSAIDASVDGDTVRVAPGVYNEQIFYNGKAITVESSGGAEVTTIDTLGAFTILGGSTFPSETYSAVVFYEGEGTDSVLRGFTVTGVDEGTSGPATGIDALGGATPTIERCRIVDNHGNYAGGVGGDAVLLDCVLSGNTTTYGAGAIEGAPTLIRCLIEDNRAGGYVGGGLHAVAPCDVIDCVIRNNVTGTDGYSGGGVFGPANLTGCVVAFNTATPYYSGVPFTSVVGGGLANVGRVDRCTVVGNTIPVPADFFAEGGGIFGATEVVNTIVRGNYPDQVPAGLDVRYSNIEGGHSGTGNIDLDPLFLSTNLELADGSPCIDAGDPATEFDADGSRADMGALANLGPLTSATGFELSVAAGGAQELALDFASVTPGSDVYLVLGSASGTQPGTFFGLVTLPLVSDAYTTVTLAQANTGPFQNTFGVYASSDPVESALVVAPGALSSGLIGLTLNHAALRADVSGIPTIVEASNPLPLTLVP